MNKKLIVLGVIVLTLVITMAVAPNKEMTAVAAPAAEKSVFDTKTANSYAKGKKAAYLSGIHMKAGTVENCEGCHSSSVIDDSEKDINAKCESCHGSLADMAKITEGEINPHSSHLGTMNCTTCHTGHTPSKSYCLNCHEFDMNISAGGKVKNEWYEDLSKYANAKPVRVEKTDIVVVGTGATGFTAAITALSKGKKSYYA